MRTGFDFERDAYAFPNETRWSYEKEGALPAKPPEETSDPSWQLRCFAMVRTARQFYLRARFLSDAPRLDPEAYEARLRTVVDSDARAVDDPSPRIEFPGYAGLRDFSRDAEKPLKGALGGILRSYFQRGNWRMILPYTKRHQEATAALLLELLGKDRPPILHVYEPSPPINHAVLIYAAEDAGSEILFQAYDPNDETAPITLRFDRAASAFRFPKTHYFGGGEVNAYVIYEGFWF